MQQLMPVAPDAIAFYLKKSEGSNPPARKRNIRTTKRTNYNWTIYFPRKVDILLALSQMQQNEEESQKPALISLRESIFSAWEQNKNITLSKLLILIKTLIQETKSTILKKLTETEKKQYKLIKYQESVGQAIFRFQIISKAIKLNDLDPDMQEKYKTHARPSKACSYKSRTSDLQKNPEEKIKLDFGNAPIARTAIQNAPRKNGKRKIRLDDLQDSKRTLFNDIRNK